MVVRENPILHPLNITESGVGTRTYRLSTVGIIDNCRGVDVPKSRQFRAFVSDVRDIDQEVRRKFSLNPNTDLLDVGASLPGIADSPLLVRSQHDERNSSGGHSPELRNAELPVTEHLK